MADEDKKQKTETTANPMVDVAKPGETPADATSRPVIVKHRSVMNDPMVAPANPSQLQKDSAPEAEATKDEQNTAPDDETVSRKGTKVVPPTLAPAKDSDTQEAAPTAEVTEPEAKNETADEPEHEQAKDSGENLGTGAVDALANEAVKKKRPSKEDLKKLEEIKKHINEKTYFAPVGQISKRRNEVRGIVLFIILLLLAGAYLAVDAGLILKDVVLPFDLIK